jgi:hypothetical protein
MNEAMLAFFFDNPNKSSGFFFFNHMSMDKYWSSMLSTRSRTRVLPRRSKPETNNNNQGMALMHKQE